jgi:hypothetical protein
MYVFVYVCPYIYIYTRARAHTHTHTGADPSFVGPEAYIIFGVVVKKKEYKITNTKLGTNVNIYLE